MKKLRFYLRKKPHAVITWPAIACFIAFIFNLISALKNGTIDSIELHQLLSDAQGFETVVFVGIMIVLSYFKRK